MSETDADCELETAQAKRGKTLDLLYYTEKNRC